MHQKTKRVRLKGKKRVALFEEVWERDDHTCQSPYCKGGSPLDIPHHITKLSQFGSDIKENLISLCLVCHRKIHIEGKLKVSGAYPDLKWERLNNG